MMFRVYIVMNQLIKEIELSNNVKQIILKSEDCLGREETEKLFLGEFIPVEHYHTIIKEDCDIYKPSSSIFGDLELLASFRKNVFPKEMTRPAFEGLRKAAYNSNNRGTAAGPVVQEKMAGNRKIAEILGGNRAKVYRSDGTVSNTVYANAVNSGIAGYFDKYARIPYCRTTAFTERNLNEFNMAIPFIRLISDKFRELVPHRWEIQNSYARQTVEDFVISDTVFTTVTVNKNFRTAGHYDAGDLVEGFGNLTVLEHGEYNGAYTGFPRYKVAIDVREGDFLGMDVHELHGNTDQEILTEGAERVSVVCYYRNKMMKCGSKKIEDAAKARFWKDNKDFRPKADVGIFAEE